MQFKERNSEENDKRFLRGEPGGVPPRRTFMDILLGTGILASLAAFFYPVLRYLVPPPAADLGVNDAVAGTVGELKPNTGKIFRFGNSPGLLVLTNELSYLAMSAVCSHLGCTVQYRSDILLVWCPCHNGRYDLQGRVVSGPPPRPLQLYSVHVRGENIFVSRQ